MENTAGAQFGAASIVENKSMHFLGSAKGTCWILCHHQLLQNSIPFVHPHKITANVCLDRKKSKKRGIKHTRLGGCSRDLMLYPSPATSTLRTE